MNEEFAAVCAAIDEHNHQLIAAMDGTLFDPSMMLDSTLNGAQYKIMDFFDVLKGIPYGETPVGVADPMLESTNRLIEKIKARYGEHGKVRELANRVALAFRSSKRLWRIREPYASVSPEVYAEKLDAARDAIFDALCELNIELDRICHQRPAKPRGDKQRRRVVGYRQAEAALKSVCINAQLADRAVNARTLQRWERGETQGRANYSPACRDSLVAFLAWARCYVTEEKSRLRSDRAIRYRDECRMK